jgi:hypothetical protein
VEKDKYHGLSQKTQNIAIPHHRDKYLPLHHVKRYPLAAYSIANCDESAGS